MTAEAAAYNDFDVFLDQLSGGLPASARAIDPTLADTARAVHAAASAQTPDPAFARHLRRSLLNQSVSNSGTPVGALLAAPVAQSATAVIGHAADGRSKQRPYHPGHRTLLTEHAAIAAIVLLVIVGLAVAGRLSLPARLGDDDPPHLAAPNVLTEDPVNAPGGTATSSESSNAFAQASMSADSEIDEPFPVGSTVVTAREDVFVRVGPSLDKEIIAFLDAGSPLIVLGEALEGDGYRWLPVRDEETGVDGFVLINWVEASPATSRSLPTPAASPAPDSVAVLFIIDKSGSMSYDPLGGTSKLEWEKETIRRALHALPDGGQFGVLAFNDQLSIAVPITRIENDADRADVERAVAAITADGGSELEPALRAGFELLRQTNATTKHAVLLTDGKARDVVPSALQRTIQTAHALGITLSVIAVGDDADTALLQFLAKTGGGRYHLIVDSSDIPTLTFGPALTIATPAAPVASTPSANGARNHDLANVLSPWSDDQ